MNAQDEGHASACEITIGFELEPACTCGLDGRRLLQAQLRACEVARDHWKLRAEKAERLPENYDR